MYAYIYIILYIYVWHKWYMMIYARCSLQDAIMLNHAVLGWHVHHHLRNYVVAASPYIYICCSWNWLKSRVAQDAERTWPDAVLNCVINLKCSGGGLWGAKVLYYCIIYKYIAYMTLHIYTTKKYNDVPRQIYIYNIIYIYTYVYR